MSSVVCQNFQSCFEPRTLGLQVSSNQLAFLCDMRSPTVSESRISTEQPHNYYNHGNNNNTYKQKTTNSDSWSSIESISKIDQVDGTKETSTYIHPLVKRSSMALSGKSLELCTETLGCETGTNVDDGNVNFSNSSMSSSSVENCGSPARKGSNSQQLAMHEKVITTPRQSFPPPLTSISHGSDCNVQFRPHREGGRLVIKAIAVATSPTCFQAERVNGRLRLLLKEQVLNEYQDQDQEEEEEDEDENDAAEEIEEEEINKDSTVIEETDGVKGDVVGEMGIGSLHRHRKCKESGNKAELAKWDQFCVAT